PRRGASKHARAPAPATLLRLRLGGEHVHVKDADLEELLHRGGDLVLVRVGVDGKGVLVAALREVKRFLADDRADDHLRGEQRHARTSPASRAVDGALIASTAARVNRSVSARRTSTTLRESARLTTIP